MCLLIGYYSDNLYKQQNALESYNGLMNFLMNCLNSPSEDEKAVVLHAIDSLGNIFGDDELVPRLEDNIFIYLEFILLNI
jgi:hypothetical protein